MKYIKLFEEFSADLITENSDGIESLKKMVKDYLGICAKERTLKYETKHTKSLLLHQKLEAEKQGKDQEVNKLDKQIEALVNKYEKEYKPLEKEAEEMKKSIQKDLNLNPKIRQILLKTTKEIVGGNFPINQFHKDPYSDFFKLIETAANAPIDSKEGTEIYTKLKKIDTKDFTKYEKDELLSDIYFFGSEVHDAKISIGKSYLKSLEDIITKTEEMLMLSAKEPKKSSGSGKITKNDVEDLLDVKAEKISVSPNEISVVVSGNELGYDDNQYYETTWYISNKRVETAAYKDRRLNNQITADVLDDEVDSLEAFAAIVNKGE